VLTRFVADLKSLLEAFVETLLKTFLKTCVKVVVKAFVEAFVKTQMSTFFKTQALYTRWNDAAGGVGAQRTRPEMTDDTSLVKVVASTTDVADVGMDDGRF
jgi:hypothetical protein